MPSPRGAGRRGQELLLEHVDVVGEELVRGRELRERVHDLSVPERQQQQDRTTYLDEGRALAGALDAPLEQRFGRDVHGEGQRLFE